MCKKHYLLLCFFILSLSLTSGRSCDWLVEKCGTDSTVSVDSGSITISNGLISRIFALSPDFHTIDFQGVIDSQFVLRSVTPEAFIQLDNVSYAIGGAVQNSTHAYLDRSHLNLSINAAAWHYSDHTISKPEAKFQWKPGTRFSPSDVNWPPKGVHLAVSFSPPKNAPTSHRSISVIIHYEIFDDLPLLAKWVEVRAVGEDASAVTVDAVSMEYLAVNREYSPWSLAPYDTVVAPYNLKGLLEAKPDIPHGAVCTWQSYEHSSDDPGAMEPVLNCTYTLGPGASLRESPFTSYRVLELLHDSTDHERRGLAWRRVTRVLAPHTMENPIFFHLTDSSPTAFKSAVDQMVEVGFEMIIFSFGSGFDPESQDPTYIGQIADLVQYANERGIEVGGYDLICLTRDVGAKWDAIDPVTHNTTGDACFASGWVDHLRSRITAFIQKTGLSMLETDGPYGGEPCASTQHEHHHSVKDSIYRQTQLQGEFYSLMRSLNVYVNQPDGYFMQGGNKAPMGYHEQQFSLPRWEDLTVSRMGMYDDTFHYLPTQGWMFVPLVQYHGGGDAAQFEPLSEHMEEYEWALAQYMGAGVAACYRGYRLYDTAAVRDMVQKWVRFYKNHRSILISDLIHLRRADMQGIDGFMHVCPHCEEKALAMIFNPTMEAVHQKVTLPLYYTGLVQDIQLQQDDSGEWIHERLARDYSVQVDVRMKPRSFTWFVVKSA